MSKLKRVSEIKPRQAIFLRMIISTCFEKHLICSSKVIKHLDTFLSEKRKSY